jgi:2-dehydropantoate 2-reductase
MKLAHLPSELRSAQMEIDLIILFTKALQLDNMLQAIAPSINQNTKVLCLLNGIGYEDTIEKYVPKENILMGNTMWTAGLEAPGKVKLFGSGSVELQNLLPEGKETALKIAEVLTEAGLHAKYSDNILHSIYNKACVNGTLNGLCTILDINIAGLGSTSVAEDMIRTIVGEFASVAAEEGIALDREKIINNIKSTFDPNGVGKHYPSMHQDLIKNNRLTEINFINGADVRKGKKYGVPTPYCSLLTELVLCKEEILGAK